VVRQTALLAYALVVGQANKRRLPQLEKELAEIDELCEDERLDSVVKFGAFVACGILGAGGQNIVFSPRSRNGSLCLHAAAGMFLFAQFGAWFPYLNFLSLAAVPTMFIGMALHGKEGIELVDATVVSQQRPVLTKPRPIMEPKTKETGAAGSLSSLSYNRARAVKQKQKHIAAKANAGAVAGAASSSGGLALGLGLSGALGKSGGAITEEQKRREEEEAEERKRKEEEDEKKRKEAEEEAKESEELQNPFRLCAATRQEQFLSFGRFVPVFDERRSGIVMLHDTEEGKGTPVKFVTMDHKPYVFEKKEEEKGKENEKEKEKEVKKDEMDVEKDEEKKSLLSQQQQQQQQEQQQ
jgi:hypothetical protein